MILPCGDTLSRWKLISSDKCILCNEKETILHLIYECNYAQTSWDNIHKAVNITISPEFIVCGRNDKCLNVIIAYVCYFLCKESVSERNGVKRFVDHMTKRLEGEFMYRRKILACTNLSGKYHILDLISKIINLCNPGNAGSPPWMVFNYWRFFYKAVEYLVYFIYWCQIFVKFWIKILILKIIITWNTT